MTDETEDTIPFKEARLRGDILKAAVKVWELAADSDHTVDDHLQAMHRYVYALDDPDEDE